MVGAEVMKKTKYQKPLTDFISGGTAAMVAKSSAAPLDLTKIYFQTHSNKEYSLHNAWKFILSTYKI